MWGTSFLFTDISVAGVPAATVVAGRVLIAAGLLTGCVVATRRPWPRGARVWLHFLALGIIGNTMPFFLISWYLIPGVALLAGIALLGEPFEWSSLAAFPLILGGIYRGSGPSGQRSLENAR